MYAPVVKSVEALAVRVHTLRCQRLSRFRQFTESGENIGFWLPFSYAPMERNQRSAYFVHQFLALIDARPPGIDDTESLLPLVQITTKIAADLSHVSAYWLTSTHDSQRQDDATDHCCYSNSRTLIHSSDQLQYAPDYTEGAYRGNEYNDRSASKAHLSLPPCGVPEACPACELQRCACGVPEAGLWP
jgi:hypothetical protein